MVSASYSLAFSISRLHKQVIMVFLLIACAKQFFCKGGYFCNGIVFVTYVGQWDNILGYFVRNPLFYQRTVETASFSKIFPYFS